MPVWMEVLINLIGYVGFIAVATMNPFAQETPALQAPYGVN